MQSLHETYSKLERNGRHSLPGETSGDKRQAHCPTVVVLGAGFGGLWATRTLAEGPVKVILIDRHNYHTFFPLLYQVGAAELEPEDIAQPVRKILWNHPNVRFYLGEVEQVDFLAKVVRVSDQDIPYDYLVMALGSRPNFYDTPGAAEYALTLKSLEQAVELRNQILTCFEQAVHEMEPELRRTWLTFTIVGGGPTGVEFAGALMELIHGSLDRDFPELDFRQIRVLLVEASDQLLTGMPKTLGDYAQTRLEKMGVEVRLKSRLIEVTPDEVLLKDGTRISSKTVIWTAGVQGSVPENQEGVATNRRNQVEVLPTLQLAGHPEVYVAGDLAGIQQEGQPLPLVAQVGIQTGSTAGRNILRSLAGQPPLPFRYQDKGTLAVIGRNAAAAYIWGRAIRGFPAWVIWLGVHILKLMGFRNRLLVLINWAWHYLFCEYGVRLITPTPTSLGKEFAEQEVTSSHPERVIERGS